MHDLPELAGSAGVQGRNPVGGPDIIQAAEADLFEQLLVVLIPIFYVDDDPANFGKREEIFQAGLYQQEHMILYCQRGYYQLPFKISGTCGIAQTEDILLHPVYIHLADGGIIYQSHKGLGKIRLYHGGIGLFQLLRRL